MNQKGQVIMKEFTDKHENEMMAMLNGRAPLPVGIDG